MLNESVGPATPQASAVSVRTAPPGFLSARRVLIVRAALRRRIRDMDWRESHVAFGAPMHAGNAREDKWHQAK